MGMTIIVLLVFSIAALAMNLSFLLIVLVIISIACISVMIRIWHGTFMVTMPDGTRREAEHRDGNLL